MENAYEFEKLGDTIEKVRTKFLLPPRLHGVGTQTNLTAKGIMLDLNLSQGYKISIWLFNILRLWFQRLIKDCYDRTCTWHFCRIVNGGKLSILVVTEKSVFHQQLWYKSFHKDLYAKKKLSLNSPSRNSKHQGRFLQRSADSENSSHLHQ